MKKMKKSPLAVAMGTAFVSGIAATSASAGTNPFGMSELSDGYMQMAEADADAGKSGEAKCGAGMGKKEGSCGEGKCGGKMMEQQKTEEGKCAGNMPAPQAADKAKEGKCGEGKCGEMMKGDKMKKGMEGQCGEMMKGKEGACGEKMNKEEAAGE